uniref:Recep_L_domain domain-containing protein n=1 Tax=Steinernema glaseri TaxID=37863 RepID=A0A1I7Z299_9BILA
MKPYSCLDMDTLLKDKAKYLRITGTKARQFLHPPADMTSNLRLKKVDMDLDQLSFVTTQTQGFLFFNDVRIEYDELKKLSNSGLTLLNLPQHNEVRPSPAELLQSIPSF